MKNWYALKVFYNKVFALRDEMSARGMESYAPVSIVTVERNGSKKKVERPMISSLLFVKATPEEAAGLQRLVEGRAMVYTRQDETSKTPSPIPDREMNIFMLVTSGGREGVEYLGDDHPRYHKGDPVRVTDGPFKGSEGHIVRIKDNRRLVVTVEGVCAVATGYIPTSFLEKIQHS